MGLLDMDRDTLYLTLCLDDEALLLRLVPIARSPEDALVRLGDYALSYLDLTLPARLRAGINRLISACEHEARAALDEGSTLRALGRAVALAYPGAKLRAKLRIASGQSMPLWPVSIRSGAPRPLEGRLWPFDAELTGLLIGSRRLLLREWLSEQGAAEDAAWLERHGFVVRTWATEGERRVLFAAHNKALIEEARFFDERVHGRGADWADAVRWMGDALGYPPCCVERFVRIRVRDDLSILVDLLPPAPAPPASALLVWLNFSLALLSFAPCSISCPAATALAQRLLSALDERHPGFAALWKTYARALHLLDEDGRCLSLQGVGSLARDASFVIERGCAILPPEGEQSVPRVTALDELRGVSLRVEHGRVIDEHGLLSAALVADHRA